MRDFPTKIDNAAPDPSGILTAEEDNVRFSEMKKVVQAAGIPLDAALGPDFDLAMLAQAVSRTASGGVFGIDQGAANTYVVNGAAGFVMPKANFVGEQVLFYPAATNTGPSTLNAWNIGERTLRDHTGAALVGGEIVAGRLTAALYDPTLNSNAGGFKLAPWANALLFVSGGGGGASTIANVGDGVGVFKERVSGVDNLRSIKVLGGLAVHLEAGGNAVVIDATPLGIGGFLAQIYPEIETADGRMAITSSPGSVVITAGQNIVYRGQKRLSTSDFSLGARTFATAANKTYHLRMRWAAGVATLHLFDVADTGYNPGALAEELPALDTSYDDMLIARVVTNGSNVPTVTALVNRPRMFMYDQQEGNPTSNNGNPNARRTFTFTTNWSRMPEGIPSERQTVITNAITDNDNVSACYFNSRSRYATAVLHRRDYATSLSAQIFLTA